MVKEVCFFFDGMGDSEFHTLVEAFIKDRGDDKIQLIEHSPNVDSFKVCFAGLEHIGELESFISSVKMSMRKIRFG